MTEDFDALFEQVSAQRSETVTMMASTSSNDSGPGEAAANTADDQIYNDSATSDSAPAVASETVQDNHNKPIFDRLGGIVRLMHDSLRELGYDRALSDAATQITDAQDRLEYIATLTEQAANKVLNTIDEGMPAQDTLAKNAKDMDSRWTQLFEGDMSLEDFKRLAADSKQFSNTVIESTETEKARLLAIMMAQDFQDITGQLIKKIVGITQKVESELAQILRDNAPPELIKEKPQELMQGPTASALVQDDVDSLLEGLGF
ncbi:MAG TPA: protein phosphatase CheZ [Burkholderiaceae bacterium]|jgi:chemotaxis protein CheZ